MGQVGDQRNHRNPLVGQRRHRFANAGVLQGHEGDAIGATAVIEQALGQHVWIEAFDEITAAAHVEG